MGQRLKKIHLLSGSKFFDTFLMILKQGLSAKIRDKIVVHSSVESIHDYIPRDKLPADYGGDEGSMKELNGKSLTYSFLYYNPAKVMILYLMENMTRIQK